MLDIQRLFMFYKILNLICTQIEAVKMEVEILVEIVVEEKALHIKYAIALN